MAGGVFSGAKLNGMTIRESATDGSDFTNPDADYRRLFLGEDGGLHLKDSAGAVTDIGGGGGDVATDTIWDAAGDLAVGSGANTAARLAIGAAGGALSRIDGAVAWNAGNAFPSPADAGDRWWRTDLAMEFYFDGTRWLSTQLFSASLFAMPDNNTTQHMVTGGVTVGCTISRLGTWVGMGDLWLVDWVQHTRVLTTNDGTKYWTLTLVKYTAAVSGTAITSFNTSGHTMGNMVTTVTAIGALIGTTHVALQVSAALTSTPGGLVADGGVVRFRVVGT